VFVALRADPVRIINYIGQMSGFIHQEVFGKALSF